jgi:hypothetical protein
MLNTGQHARISAGASSRKLLFGCIILWWGRYFLYEPTGTREGVVGNGGSGTASGVSGRMSRS